MKKVSIIVTLVTVLCLCACHSVLTDIPDMPEGNIPYPYSEPLEYDSLIDLKNAISQEKEEQIYTKFRKDGMEEEKLAVFQAFLEKFRSQNMTVPYFNGQVMEFRNETGFANIALFADEAYNLPCLFFFPKVSTGENFYIKITYIPDDIMQKLQNPGASEVIQALSPNSPNINNLGDQHKKIYHQAITLHDREVIALMMEYKTDSRNSTVFVYDDWLVELRSDPEVWSAAWFSALSFDSFVE